MFGNLLLNICRMLCYINKTATKAYVLELSCHTFWKCSTTFAEHFVYVRIWFAEHIAIRKKINLLRKMQMKMKPLQIFLFHHLTSV